MSPISVWILVVFFAVWAGVLDWRSRRIPNWLTASGLVAGIVANAAIGGWRGAGIALLGAVLGLGLLLPLVLLRALGAGDWKLAGAMGALLGPRQLLDVLIAAMIVAGIMATVLVIVKGRLRETLRNMGHLLQSLVTLQKPGPEVSLDNPQATKVPFGVAMAAAAVLFSAWQAWHLLRRA